MQREFDVIDYESLIPVFTGNIDISETVFDNWNIGVVGNVILMSPSRVVGMPVCDYCIFYRPPRIEVNIGLFAVNTLVVKSQ